MERPIRGLYTIHLKLDLAYEAEIYPIYNIPISTRKKPTGKLFKNALYHAVLFCSVLINVFTIC